jgi:hypothetical protein
MGYCVECGFQNEELFRTVYGEVLCYECWCEYVETPAGKVEHFIAICEGACPVEMFDADELGLVVQSYLENKNDLDYEPSQLLALEDKARELKLL